MLHRFDFQCNNFDEDQHLLMKLRGVCYYSDGEDSEDAGDVGGSGEDGQGTSNSDSDSFSSMSDRDDAEDVAGFGEDRMLSPKDWVPLESMYPLSPIWRD